jgi:tape measure domain-containing protein
MSLDIAIKVDPGASAREADKVTTSLHKAEDTGLKAQKAFDNLTGTFKRMAEAMHRADTATTEYARALKHEWEMLDKLHAPMVQAQRDLQALESLHKKGMISAKQYGDELARVGAAAGIKPRGNPMDAVSLGPTPQASGGDGGFGGGLATMAKATAVGGIVTALGGLVSAWAEEEAANRQAFFTLRKYFDSAEATNAIVDEQTASARLLGVTLQEQAGAFGAVKEASAEMYLTTLDQIKVTQTLGEIMKLNGKPMGDVGNVMKQLQLAMETGSLSAMQFKTILREYPDIVEQWAKGTGRSKDELLKLSNAGKLGETELRGFMTSLVDGADVHRKYAEASDGTGNSIKLTGNKMYDAMAEVGNYDLKMKRAAAAEQEAARDALALSDAIERVTLSLKDNARAAEEAFQALAAQGAGSLVDGMNSAHGAFNRLFNDPWGDSPLERGLKALGFEAENAGKKAKSATKQFEDLIHTVPDWHIGGDDGMVPDAISGGGPPDLQRGDGWRDFDGFNMEQESEADRFKRLMEAAKEGMEGAAEATKKIGEEQRKIAETQAEWNKKLEITTVLEDQIVANVQTLSTTLVDAAFGADVAWTDMLENMAKNLAAAILQAQILSALGPMGIGLIGPGGLLGGKVGFDAMVPGGNGRSFLPGFAQGGDMMVGGSGGTDSKIAAFRVTPGETIHVRTPQQQQQAARGGGGGPAAIHNHVHFDRRDLLSAINTKEGQQAVLNVIRLNPDLIKAGIGR